MTAVWGVHAMWSRALLRLLALALIGAVALGGCGSSSSSDEERTLRGTIVGFPDYLDPALSVTLEGWTAMWNSYLPLLTYRHAEGRAGTELIPGLARALPKISDGGRTYTLYLRKGLHYSDGTAVRASDFRASVERLLALNSGGSVYFADVVGAERFQRTKRGGIPGIESDDSSGRITIHLRAPRGTFAFELATLYAALLPADTPVEDLSADPPPATGPYEISSSRPGQSWSYRRNPEWASSNAALLPQLPGGHFDQIEIDVIRNDQTQVNDVERGQYDWMVNPPPSSRLAELRQRFAGTQLLFPPQINVFYFWMNASRPPFDDVRVRRAVNYAIDPAALDRIYAGQLRPLQQILPAAMPGHRTFRLYPHDMAKARQLIAAADPADRQIDVWTNNFPTNLEAGEYYEGVLRELGFDPTLKAVDGSNFFTLLGNVNTPNLDTGWGNWLLEYAHPNNYFEPQLTGGAIQQTGNTNWAQFDDPALDAEVERLRQEPLGPAQEAAYARLDRRFMREAPWAPFGTLSFPTFVAPDVDARALIVSPVYGQDLTSFRLK